MGNKKPVEAKKSSAKFGRGPNSRGNRRNRVVSARRSAALPQQFELAADQGGFVFAEPVMSAEPPLSDAQKPDGIRWLMVEHEVEGIVTDNAET